MNAWKQHKQEMDRLKAEIARLEAETAEINKRTAELQLLNQQRRKLYDEKIKHLHLVLSDDERYQEILL